MYIQELPGVYKMEEMKVLLVEDDCDIRDLIKLQLENASYHVTCAGNGNAAIDMIKANDFDLFILDRMLPEKDGVEICKYIRATIKFKGHPILMVTAMTAPEKVIEGLDAGADDYIGKPFDLDVLMARIRCLARRVPKLQEADKSQSNISEFGPFKMDHQNYRFYLLGEEISLTKSEFGLMSHLMLNIGRVLSREELKKEIQGDDVHVTDRTIDTHIFGLRKKLKTSAAQVESVRGIGYRLNEKIGS